ncbi:MAG TPA: enoyl-CoA hydratase/isomerase family protein, partial [Saprospiraceae bacterium]|nr:enoyl-CoA hydratase/isomerase family protein [Saprospiraceae bacterium]
TAYWAKEKGLYNEVFETQTQCDAYLESFLINIEAMSSEAKTAVKTMLWHDTDHWDQLLNNRAAQSARLLMTESCRNEINKFLSKSV